MSLQPSDDHQVAKNKALERLLGLKGPVRAQKQVEQPFLDALDEVLAVMDTVDEEAGGWLSGSISGQRWQDFMEQLRYDLLNHLQRYRDAARNEGFCPASLASLLAERQRAERMYIRDLVAVYHNAAQAYKSLSG